MGANIRAAKRVRRAHARLAALADDDVPPAAAEDEPGLELDRVDDAPWRAGGGAPGDALRWAGGRVVEHAGFQGASARALDALGSVAGEYLANAGRTLRFLADKYGGAMPPEEMVLHALFEAGVPDVRDLERYIQEDVVRHGVRMGELEKKLVTAYNDTVRALWRRVSPPLTVCTGTSTRGRPRRRRRR
jgi:transcriptional activator SPT7